MIAVIIAGGSGTRLWPLSTPDYPKHLLKVNGDKLSLLQHTYERAKRLSQDIYVVSEAGHVHFVKEQLSQLNDENFIIEPGRRGTANCILAALSHISAHHKDLENESIAFMHADHYIRDTLGFVSIFKLANRMALEQKRIVLVGVEPDNPATGFGYIEKGDLLEGMSFIYEVASFKEKPNYQTARRYLNSGRYLWNGGYFVATLPVFLDEMKNQAPELMTSYDLLTNAGENFEKTYLSLEPESIDYALIEKVSDLLVISAAFDWVDLGSYADLAKTIGGDEMGNYLSGDNIKISEVKNTYISNQEDKPVVVIGLDNVVVANTPNGLLVTRKDLSQSVGEISKNL
jgi:mannose-1-phosphate guanylyltransferase/mannose-6-phosphate isomerase